MTKQAVTERMESLKDRFEHGAYCEACEQFAKDTAEWGGMQSGQMYTMQQDGTWTETCDNAHNGPSVAWAFHETFTGIEDLNNRCTVHYNAWLEENYSAMLEEIED